MLLFSRKHSNAVMSMKIIVLGDLHYPREGKLFHQFLDLIKKENIDLILLCGDILNYGNVQYLRVFLSKIHKRTEAKIIAVMGNHDFWLSKNMIRRGLNSWNLIDVYRGVFKEYGDFPLWDKELIVDDIGFAGVPGWYDYSFADWKFRMNRYILDSGYYMGYQWNDFIFTRFNMKVEDILEIHLKNLRNQLDRLRKSNVEKVVVLLHFVPLREFIKIRNIKEDFWNAYLGSEKLGSEILKYSDIVRYVFFGHTDKRNLSRKALRVNWIYFINVDVSHNLSNMFIFYF